MDILKNLLQLHLIFQTFHCVAGSNGVNYNWCANGLTEVTVEAVPARSSLECATAAANHEFYVFAFWFEEDVKTCFLHMPPEVPDNGQLTVRASARGAHIRGINGKL